MFFDFGYARVIIDGRWSIIRSFLHSESHLPLLGISSGGASSPLHYACLLYGTANGIGRANTPLEFASISDNVLIPRAEKTGASAFIYDWLGYQN